MLERAHAVAEQLVAWRRDFHQYPELGFQETRTAARVAEELEALGYDVKAGTARTGVVADRGSGPPVITVRADMDALPIQEENDVPYTSQNPGVMHACGHDAHTAIALGVATLLADTRFPGTLRFLFQPAEETQDEEGRSGAQRMIEDGVMENVGAVLALHVDSSVPVGHVVTKDGPSSAGVDSFRASILGDGGHGAYPHTVVDPIHIAGHVILGLHAIVSRRLHPREPAVISIGSIHGGQADNVIPDRVELTGTIRYIEPEVQEQLHAEIEQALGIAAAMGGDHTLQIVRGYPPTSNDPVMIRLLERVGVDLMGTDHVKPGQLEMGSEDFGYYGLLAPSAMFGLGCRIDGDERRHHNPRFDIDERCLPVGAAVLAEAALRLLRGEATRPGETG